MMGPTHATIGAGAGLLVALAAHADLTTTSVLMTAGALAALLPDIDHPKSAVRRKMGLLGRINFLFPKHRGITHTVLALALVAIAARLLAPALFAPVAAGYASHLVADMLTISGLPVLYPLYKERLYAAPPFMRVRTGSLVEWLLGLILCILIGLTAYGRFHV